MSVMDVQTQLQLFVEIFTQLTLFAKCQPLSEIKDLANGLYDKINEQRKETALSDISDRQLANAVAYLKTKGLLE